MSRHTPTKPVACPQCPRRFFDKNGLKKHLEVHIEADYVCDICGSVMRSKASYYEHKRKLMQYAKIKIESQCETIYFNSYRLQADIKRQKFLHVKCAPNKSSRPFIILNCTCTHIRVKNVSQSLVLITKIMNLNVDDI